MPLQNIQRSDPIVQSSWAGGMITALPPEELPEDAAVLIENFEFDDVGNLKSRFAVREGEFDFGITDAITSIFVANYSNGTRRVYATAGSQLYEITGAIPGTAKSNITGAFTFPSGNRWYWAMFDDFAIGIHGSSTERPIKIDNAGTVTTLNVSAPFASHGVVWNDRLWLSGVGSNRNTIFGSAVNDPEDWTVDNDAGAITLGIDIGDGDRIKALSVFRGNLFAYKVNKINVVSAISAPATIPANLRVDLYTDKLGCPFPATVQNVLDDQVFLSLSGVASLALAPLGELRGSILSNNIRELGEVSNFLSDSVSSGLSACAITYTQKQQYWLALPGPISGPGNVVWVMDYSDIKQQDSFGNPKVRWCRFTGDAFGDSYSAIIESGYDTLLVGVPATILGTNSSIGWYAPIGASALYTNANIATVKTLTTRAYGISSERSLWHRLYISLNKLTTNVTFTVNYFYDLFTTSAGSYSHVLTGTPNNNNRTIWRQFKKNDSGRKSNLVQLQVFANTIDQGFTIKSVGVKHTPLNHRHATNTWNSD